MDAKLASLVLVAAAFIIGVLVTDRSSLVSNGPTLATELTTVCLVMLTSASVYLWYRHLIAQAKRNWTRILEMVDGEFSRWRVALRGTDNGTPVYVRIDSEAPRNGEDHTPQATEKSKCLYALTMAFPVTGDADWSIVPTDHRSTPDASPWQLVTADSELRQKFEEADLSGLLAGCDEAASLVCDARAGELTLQYPAPDTYYCPDPDAFRNELELLRKAVGLWNQKTRSTIAV